MTIVQDGSRFFEVNYTPTAGAGEEVLWTFAQVLDAAGWIGIQFGNGTTKSSGFPGVNPFVAGTTGWIQMRAPTGTFEITLQRDSGNDWSARGYASMVAFGLGGSASAPPSPPASVSWQIIGTSGNYDSGGWIWANTSAAVYRWSFCADSVAHRGFYYFHAIARSRTSPYNAHRALIFDTVNSPADGSIGDADAAPFFMLRGQGSFANPNNQGADVVLWYRYGLSGALLDETTAVEWGAPYNFASRGQNPYTGVHEKAPVDLVRLTTNIQDKGRTNNLRWLSGSIATYDTVDFADAGEALIHYQNGLLLPWPSGVVPSP